MRASAAVHDYFVIIVQDDQRPYLSAMGLLTNITAADNFEA